MESWCFDSLEKSYVTNETVPPCDSITRTKNVSMGLEFKDPFSCDNDMMIPSQPTVGSPGFPEVDFAADMLRTQFPHDSGRNVFNTNGGVGAIVSTNVDTSNAISGVDDSTLNLTSSVVDSKCLGSSLFDLKLGGFGNKPNSDSSRAALSESTRPAKRARATNFGSQTAYCRVYKCNKDLSSAKDYYKRHRVCEAHSKTAKVIVNGIEQRFCQQCSRFHLVAEFDNGKRSCRKRLAGHNARRRKPQGSFIGTTTRMPFHSHAGSEGSWFQGSTLTLTSTSNSSMCHEMNAFSTSEKHKRNVKEEDGFKCVQKSENTCTNTQQQQSVLLQNPQGIVSNLFQTNPLMNEDFELFDGASTVEALQRTSDSSCALSLLSSHLHQVGNHNQTRHIRQDADGFFSGLVNTNFTNSQ